MLEAGGRAGPTLVPGEELVRGGINKPEIFQTGLNTLFVELRKRTTQYMLLQDTGSNVVFFRPLTCKDYCIL